MLFISKVIRSNFSLLLIKYFPETFKPNEEGVAMLQSMGFSRSQCVKALQNTDNNVERAADWIFSHPDEINSDDFTPALSATPANAPTVSEPTFSDGPPGI